MGTGDIWFLFLCSLLHIFQSNWYVKASRMREKWHSIWQYEAHSADIQYFFNAVKVLSPFLLSMSCHRDTEGLCFLSHISHYVLLLPLCSSTRPQSRIIQCRMWCNESVDTVNMGLAMRLVTWQTSCNIPMLLALLNLHQCSAKKQKWDLIQPIPSHTPAHPQTHTLFCPLSWNNVFHYGSLSEFHTTVHT